MVYAFLYLLLIFGSVFYDILGKDKYKDVLYLIEGLALVLVAGLRYKVGGDTQYYYEQFDLMPSLSQIFDYDFSSERFNLLWVLLTAICKSIINDFTFFQIVHALIVNISFLYFFRKYCKWYFTATLFYGLLYFFTFNTEILRGALAVSVFLWSFQFLVDRKWIPYFVCFVAAYGFHTEAIMMLLLPVIHILKRVKMDRNYMIILVAVTLFFTLLVNFTALFEKFSSVSEKMSNSIAFYLDSDRTGSVSFLGYCKFFVFQLPCLFFLWVTPNKYLKGVLSIYYFLIFQSLHYSNLIQRELDFVYPLLVMAIADACARVHKMDGKYARLYKLGTIFSIALILFQHVLYYVSDNHWLLFLPYSSVFNPVDNPIREELFYMLQHQY